MDHLLEHESDAVPASGSGASSTSTGAGGNAMDVDDDDDDADVDGAGFGDGDVEAKVRHAFLCGIVSPVALPHCSSVDRASNVRSATRRFEIPPWRTSMPKRAGTINSRKVQKRYVNVMHIYKTCFFLANDLLDAGRVID